MKRPLNSNASATGREDREKTANAQCLTCRMRKTHARFFGLILLCMASASMSFAQTFNTVFTFSNSGGLGGPTALVQGADGNLWGTSDGGCGNAFFLTLAGALTTTFTFDCTNGSHPLFLLLGADGNYYGTTFYGGVDDDGVIFKLIPPGSVSVGHQFDGTDGFEPEGMIQAAGGNFYGATLSGGSLGNGVLFKLTPGGTFSIFHDFLGTDGSGPSIPVQGADGNFYGTTYGGGAYGEGTVYKITPAGVLIVLYSFGATSSDGLMPFNSLTLASDGDFYGTTPYGGPGGLAHGNGTLFKITPTGTFTNLHNFNGTDGSFVGGGLVQATDGYIYGTAIKGGANGIGTVFRTAASGGINTVYAFSAGDGSNPYGLIQDTNGAFYGITNPTSSNAGTVFSLSVGLAPFVTTVQTNGPVGTAVTILGTDLTGATAVSFHGTSATFTVVSSSEITTTVPAGATSGVVTVTTPSGTLTSNTIFRVP